MALECDTLSTGDGPELRDLVIKNGCVVPLINLAQPDVSVSLSTMLLHSNFANKVASPLSSHLLNPK